MWKYKDLKYKPKNSLYLLSWYQSPVGPVIGKRDFIIYQTSFLMEDDNTTDILTEQPVTMNQLLQLFQ